MSNESITPDDLKAMKAESHDFDPLFRYRDRVTSDPLRLHILAAHTLIEELIELVIAEASQTRSVLTCQVRAFGKNSKSFAL